MIDRIKNFFLQYRFAILIVVLIIIGIIFRILQPSTSPTPEAEISYTPSKPPLSEITPGKTNRNQLTQQLGQPISRENTALGEKLSYSSNQSNTFDEIYIQDNTVVFYKQKFNSNPGILPNAYTNQLSETPTILYGSDSGAGYHLYYYPNSGVAIYASEFDKVGLEIWSFSPISQQQFLNTWGSEFSIQLEREPYNPIENPVIPTP